MKNAKILILVLVVVLLLPWLYAATTSLSSGRFQLVFGKVEMIQNSQNFEVPVCFKIDTETGAVWQYKDEYTRVSDGFVETWGFVSVTQGEGIGDITTKVSPKIYSPVKEPNLTGQSKESEALKVRFKEPNEKRVGTN